MTRLGLIVKLHRNAAVVDLPEGLLLHWRFGSVTLGPEFRDTVERLRAGGVPDTFEYPPELSNMLTAAAGRAEAPLATVEAVSRHFRLAFAPPDAARPYLLSRFALVRRLGSEMALESPLAHARLLLHAPRALAAVGALGRPARWTDLPCRAPGLSAEEAEALCALLLCAGMLEVAGEPEPASLVAWEFHDLLFHSRSRAGRHDARMGPTGRLRDLAPPPSESKEPPEGKSLALHVPVGETEPAAGPVSAPRLGEFLYRACRSAELEIYALVRECPGIAPGLYYYEPRGHRLHLVSEPSAETGRLLPGDEPPPVLVICAARFAAFSWRYESMAYALLLKRVGALLERMSGVARAIGLEGRSLDWGDSDAFAAAAGGSYCAEGSVGEFQLR